MHTNRSWKFLGGMIVLLVVMLVLPFLLMYGFGMFATVAAELNSADNWTRMTGLITVAVMPFGLIGLEIMMALLWTVILILMKK